MAGLDIVGVVPASLPLVESAIDDALHPVQVYFRVQVLLEAAPRPSRDSARNL